MIIRVSFMVVASVTALKISQTKTTSPTKRNCTIKSPANKESDGSHLEHEFEERENSTANANHVIQKEEGKKNKIEMPQNLLIGEFKDYVTEKELLQNLIQNYKQREVNLESKLVALNGMKEEKSAIAQMQRQLEKKTAKLDSLKETIASLQSESKTIREKIREDVLSKMQLDIANKIINEMQRKKDINGSPVKDQILMLQQQVTKLQMYKGSGRNAMVNKKLKDVQGIELEVLELKRRNKELELEKREIGIKLATTQARIRTEEETVTQIQEEIIGLWHVHEELSEQVETLQRNRFNMVQELVYQRWLYTCLRFEAHDHQKQIRKASRQDCSQKTHASTSDTELDSISSNATLNESDEIETTTFESSSSSQSSSRSKNSSLLNKMKRWKKAKDYNKKISPKGRNSPSSPGLLRRFSMSMVESQLSKERNISGDSPVMNLSQKIKMKSSSMSIEKPITQRLKRVSFNDSVKPSTDQDMPEAVEDVIDDKETTSGKIMELTSTITSSDEHVAEQYDKPCKSNECAVGNPINVDSPAGNEGTKNQIGYSDDLCSKNELVGRKHDKVKTQLVQQLAFFIFSLILLAYFRIK